jgi:hypothetical protein
VWTVESTPSLVLGGIEEDSLFGRVSAALRLPDGRIVAADERGAHLRIFATDGTFLNTWGRQGAGPGEFQMPNWLSLCDGSGLYVFDPMAAVLTTLGWEGSVIETIRILPSNSHPIGSPVCNRHGEMAVVAQVAMPSPLPMGLFRPSVTVSVGRHDGQFRDLVKLPGPDFYRSERQTGPLGDFARQPRLAIGERSVYIATGDFFEFAEYGLDGHLLMIVRAREVRRSPIVPADLERVRQEQLAATNARYHEQLEQSLAAMQWPLYHPVLEGLLVDTLGCIWLLHTQGEMLGRVWRVFTRAGAPVGIVTLPDDFLPTVAAEHELIGITRPGINGGQVRIYEYSRSPATSC